MGRILSFFFWLFQSHILLSSTSQAHEQNLKIYIYKSPKLVKVFTFSERAHRVRHQRQILSPTHPPA